MSELTFIGLDVHARSVAAGVLEGSTGEVRSCTPPPRTAELIPWLREQGEPVSVAYEAGPTGFGLARACAAAGIPCLVAAPSKIARASGGRVKTDRRDALRLAKPLRQGLVWEGSAWTQGHEHWLAGQRFAERGLAVAYEEALGAIVCTQGRRDALDRAIAEEAAKEPWAGAVGRLSCLRGVSTLTAFGLATEIGDWRRFDGRAIGAYLGLVPSESSSGERRRQGAITKTGNGHARRLLVEAAWHHRRQPRVSRELARRREGQPALVRERAVAAERRLHHR